MRSRYGACIDREAYSVGKDGGARLGCIKEVGCTWVLMLG